MKLIRTAIYPLIFVLLFNTGCSSSTPDLLGKWVAYPLDGKEIIEFFEDNTCVIEAGNEGVAGKWFILDDGRIKIEITVFGGSTDFSFATINDNDILFLNYREMKTAFAREGSVNAKKFEKGFHVEQLAREGEKEQERGNYGEAEKIFIKAAENGTAAAYNILAWFYATCKSPKYRNGEKAVEYAIKATQEFEDETYVDTFVDTLAAAYARNKQFDRAVSAQKRAITLLNESNCYTENKKKKMLSEYNAHLNLYKDRRPYSVK